MIDSDGRSRSYGRPDPSLCPVTIRLADRRVPWNIVRSPSVGIGEAYMDGRLSVENGGGILDMLALVGFNNRWSADSPPQLSWRGIVRPDQRDPRVVSWIYWMVVVLLSIVGTLLTDNLSDNLGVSLYASTGAFAAGLIVTFVLWYRSERTLSIHDITTTRREAYYWAAILFTFALGTASGDLVAEQLGLGYVTAAAISAARSR